MFKKLISIGNGGYLEITDHKDKRQGNFITTGIITLYKEENVKILKKTLLSNLF